MRFQHCVIQRAQSQVIRLFLLPGDHLADKGRQHPGATRGDFPTHTGAVLQAGGKGFTIPNARLAGDAVGHAPFFVQKDDSAVGVAGGLGSEQPRFAQLGVIDQPQSVTVVIGRSPAERLRQRMGFIQRGQRDLAICRRNGLILPVVAALVQQRRQDGQQFLALKHTQRHWLRVMENRGGDNFRGGSGWQNGIVAGIAFIQQRIGGAGASLKRIHFTQHLAAAGAGKRQVLAVKGEFDFALIR